MSKDIHEDSLGGDVSRDQGVVDEMALKGKIKGVADAILRSGLTVEDFLEPYESIEIAQDVGKYKIEIKKLLKLDQEVLQDSPGGDLENKMASQDTISPQEIKDYGKSILNNLNLMKGNSRQDQQAFIVDALSYKRIWAEFVEKFEDSDIFGKEDFEKGKDDPEVIVAVERIRNLIVDQIKDHVDYVVLEKFGYGRTADRPVSGKNRLGKGRNIIDLIEDIKTGEHFVYKDQAFLGGLQENEKDFREAFKIFIDLPRHPNIIGMREYDEENHRVVYEAENLTNLRKYLESLRPQDDEKKEKVEKNKQALLVVLSSLKDNISGAAFLEQHGLVLLDISPANIGIVSQKDKSKRKKGMLFDLEYVVKKDTPVKDRPRIGDIYIAPEAHSDDGASKPVQPSEMVWQFGWCLNEIIDSFDRSGFVTPEQMNSLGALFGSMTEEAPQDRMSLAQAETELGRIISSIATDGEEINN